MFRSKAFLLKFVVLMAGIVLLTAPMLGQTFYGSVVGTVTDTAGAAMPGVEVTLTNNGTSAVHTATTSGVGTYRFVNLQPGNYKVEAEQAGFKHFTRDNVTVEVESTMRVDVSMEVGDVAETIEVTAEAPLMKTESADMSEVVSGRSVEELPLNGRNVLNLAALVPGVVPQGSSMMPLTGQNIFAAGNYQIGGGMANQSAMLYDGVPTQINYGNLTGLVPTQDAVSEFRVQTNNSSAEYGRYTGGVVNMASKSGTNEFHGSAYELLRNKKLNSVDYFSKLNNAGKTAFTQNQYGANLGGPIVKDKTFFFFAYEGYRRRFGRAFNLTVPTEAQLAGDFSQKLNASGNLIPIYDPDTQCGAYGNAACVSGQPQRSVFGGNIIPKERFDNVAKGYVNFPYWAKPNVQGTQYTNQYNYFNQASAGGDNDQYNIRGDHTLSAKNRLFGRYTRWESKNLPADVYGNTLVSGDPISPEYFLTQQAIIGDTHLFSPTTIFDIRASYMRFFNERTPGTLGVDLTSVGFPHSFADGLPTDRVTLTRMGLSGYDSIGTGSIGIRANNYVIETSVTKIAGAHTLKFGADIRLLQNNYWQNNNAGGSMTFSNRFTAANGASPGATGDAFASFLLGLPDSGYAETVNWTANYMYYQGYYANDTWQVNPKLTINMGLRWEIPGVQRERFDRVGSLFPDIPNPVGERSGYPVNGEMVLVDTPLNPQKGVRIENFKLFAPRFGFAYRLSDKTVVRAGAGLFYVPSDTAFWEAGIGQPINIFQNAMISTVDNSVTYVDTLENPFPNGLVAAPGRDPSYSEKILGLNPRAPFRDQPWGYTEQWNFAVQHQIAGFAIEAAYAGSHGVHLADGGQDFNVIAEQFLSQGTGLYTQVPNPFYGYIATGTLSAETVQYGQLLRRFPQYTGFRESSGKVGNSIYHSLQMKAEKRFSGGGRLLAAYTFSKLISDVESNTSWLDGGQSGGYQNFNNLRLERSLASWDSRHRFTLSYVYDLPFGQGKKFLPDASGVAGKLVSGWGVNGITTLQLGFPINMTASPNRTGFGTGLRPNVVPGCDPKLTGSAESRIYGWFDTSCYTVPDAFTFGNASRTDPTVRTDGTNNWDFAFFKRTAITERFNLEFRAEFFNLFNNTQFGRPDTTATTSATSTFGNIRAQFNEPRLTQLGLRLNW